MSSSNDDDNDPPYSTVRQLRAEYLARVASSSTSSRSASSSRPPRRGTVFGTKPTISLPYIPEVEEVKSVGLGLVRFGSG